MNDEQIMQRGGDESDIEAYSEQNGANLTKLDVQIEQLREKYNEMWNKGKFEWNYHDGETPGTKPFSLERIWNVFIEPQLTEAITTAKREVIQEVQQKLREIKLLDYYCKCDDVGHVIAMPRAEYDRLITHLESELTQLTPKLNK